MRPFSRFNSSRRKRSDNSQEHQNRSDKPREQETIVVCDLCGNTVLDDEEHCAHLIDGAVCRECLTNNCIDDLPAANYTLDELKQLVEGRRDLVDSFSQTRGDDFFKIDDEHESIWVGANIFSFANVIGVDAIGPHHLVISGSTSAEYLQGSIELSQTNGDSTSGNVSFGSLFDSPKLYITAQADEEMPPSLNVCVFLKDTYLNVIYLPFESDEIALAYECISTIRQIIEVNRTRELRELMGNAVQPCADEIRKLKELADDNIISQEEFEAKKQQLLGL